MNCDHVFVVAQINRAITDQSLKSSLYDVLARHVSHEWQESGGKRLNVSVVCTKSEDINQKTAQREFCGNSKRISPSKMEELDRDIQRAKNKNDANRKQALDTRQVSLLGLLDSG